MRPPAIRRAVVAVAAAAVAVAALAAPARAGTFRVSQCNAVAPDAGPRGYQASLWSVDGGWPEVDCGDAGGMVRIGTPNWRLWRDAATETRFALPQTLPATSLSAAWIDWRLPPQAPSTNPAYLIVGAAGARLLQARPGDGTWPGAPTRIALPRGARGMAWDVWCSPVNGPGWCTWPSHLLELRGMTFELEEDGEPSATVAGALAAGGAHAGVEPLEVDAADGDSGVRRVALLLGGVPAGVVEPAEGCRDDRLPPCPQVLRRTVDVDTRAVGDGAQRLRLVVTDAAGNVRTVDAGTVAVHNAPEGTPPGGGSAGGGPPGGGPAGGGSSGGGSLGGGSSGGGSSAGGPAGGGSSGGGRSPFPPNPLAGHGHAPNGSHAGPGAHLRAWLELPTPHGIVRRRKVRVPRGARVRIRGRLTDARGRAVGRAVLAAIRRERGGPWCAVTGVRTRADGRFTAFTRLGPSQDVRFVYYPYADSQVGRRSALLRVTVVPR